MNLASRWGFNLKKILIQILVSSTWNSACLRNGSGVNMKLWWLISQPFHFWKYYLICCCQNCVLHSIFERNDSSTNFYSNYVGNKVSNDLILTHTVFIDRGPSKKFNRTTDLFQGFIPICIYISIISNDNLVSGFCSIDSVMLFVGVFLRSKNHIAWVIEMNSKCKTNKLQQNSQKYWSIIFRCVLSTKVQLFCKTFNKVVFATIR